MTKEKRIKQLNQNNMCEFRTELLGVAAVAILIAHSRDYISYPNIVRTMVSYCGLAVYIFVFLSGIGLYYSMRMNYEGTKLSILNFYKRRISRVLLPYLIIAGIWYGIKYLLLDQSVFEFLYELSTISFWVEHRGAWYVAMIIPIYILYPWFYIWFTEKGGLWKTVSILVVAFAIKYCLYILNPTIHEHLNQVLNSIFIFIIGNYYGLRIYHGKAKNGLLFVLAIFVFMIGMESPLETVVVIQKISRSFLGIAIAIIMAEFLYLCPFKWIHYILKYCGEISLELYLCNIFLIQAEKEFGIQQITRNYFSNSNEGGIVYLMILIMGIVFSVIFKKLCNKARGR